MVGVQVGLGLFASDEDGIMQGPLARLVSFDTADWAREWHEELVAEFEPVFTPYALLNDDTTEVGAVHLGVVILAEAEGRPVSVRETEKLSGAFATPAEIAAGAEHLETWSRIVFDALETAGTTPRR